MRMSIILLALAAFVSSAPCYAQDDCAASLNPALKTVMESTSSDSMASGLASFLTTDAGANWQKSASSDTSLSFIKDFKFDFDHGDDSSAKSSWASKSSQGLSQRLNHDSMTAVRQSITTVAQWQSYQLCITQKYGYDKVIQGELKPTAGDWRPVTFQLGAVRIPIQPVVISMSVYGADKSEDWTGLSLDQPRIQTIVRSKDTALVVIVATTLGPYRATLPPATTVPQNPDLAMPTCDPCAFGADGAMCLGRFRSYWDFELQKTHKDRAAILLISELRQGLVINGCSGATLAALQRAAPPAPPPGVQPMQYEAWIGFMLQSYRQASTQVEQATASVLQKLKDADDTDYERDMPDVNRTASTRAQWPAWFPPGMGPPPIPGPQGFPGSGPSPVSGSPPLGAGPAPFAQPYTNISTVR